MADWMEKLDEYVARYSEDYAQKRVDFLGVNPGGVISLTATICPAWSRAAYTPWSGSAPWPWTTGTG